MKVREERTASSSVCRQTAVLSRWGQRGTKRKLNHCNHSPLHLLFQTAVTVTPPTNPIHALILSTALLFQSVLLFSLLTTRQEDLTQDSHSSTNYFPGHDWWRPAWTPCSSCLWRWPSNNCRQWQQKHVVAAISVCALCENNNPAQDGVLAEWMNFGPWCTDHCKMYLWFCEAVTLSHGQISQYILTWQQTHWWVDSWGNKQQRSWNTHTAGSGTSAQCYHLCSAGSAEVNIHRKWRKMDFKLLLWSVFWWTLSAGPPFYLWLITPVQLVCSIKHELWDKSDTLENSQNEIWTSCMDSCLWCNPVIILSQVQPATWTA